MDAALLGGGARGLAPAPQLQWAGTKFDSRAGAGPAGGEKTTRKGKKPQAQRESAEGQPQYMGKGNGRGGERELSYTQVIRQHGGQRLRSLQKHRSELVRVSKAMATLGINTALRGLTLEFIIDECRMLLARTREGIEGSDGDGGGDGGGTTTGGLNGSAQGLGAPGAVADEGLGRVGPDLEPMQLAGCPGQDHHADSEAKVAAAAGAAVRVLHVDWGGATGDLAAAVAAVLQAGTDGIPAGSIELTTRSFDLVPAVDGVEFGDQSVPAPGIAPGSVDIVTGVANLENPLDLPGACPQPRCGTGRQMGFPAFPAVSRSPSAVFVLCLSLTGASDSGHPFCPSNLTGQCRLSGAGLHDDTARRAAATGPAARARELGGRGGRRGTVDGILQIRGDVAPRHRGRRQRRWYRQLRLLAALCHPHTRRGVPFS